MAKTRHYGIISIAIVTASQALASLCGQSQFVEGLQTGNYAVIGITVIDYIIARVKNAKGNSSA